MDNNSTNNDRSPVLKSESESPSSVNKELQKFGIVQPLPDPLLMMDVEEHETKNHESVARAKAPSTVPLEQPPQTQPQQPQKEKGEEAPVDQILRFWNHPALQHVAPSEKEAYLMTQKGITKAQLYQAWDQLLATTAIPNSTATTTKKVAPIAAAVATGSPSFPSQPQPPNSNNPHPSYNDTSTPPGTHQQHQQQQQNYNPSYQPPPPYQQQHQQQPYNNTMMMEGDEMDDQLGVGSPQQIAMIAALGGFLGLWAAAAVRWLNGGDFQVLPPPSRDHHQVASSNNDGRVEKAGQFLLQQGNHGDHLAITNVSDQLFQEDTTTEIDGDDRDGQEVENSDGDNEEGSEYDEAEEEDPMLADYLAASNLPPTTTSTDVLAQAMLQLASFSDTMQQHVSVQQRILQKLSNSGNINGRSVTDQSMQALRRKQQGGGSQSLSTTNVTNNITTEPPSMSWYKLVEIQVELASLHRTHYVDASPPSTTASAEEEKKAPTELEVRLGQVLVRLEGVLKDMAEQQVPPQNPISADDDGVTESAPITDGNEQDVKADQASDDATTLEVKSVDKGETSLDEADNPQPAKDKAAEEVPPKDDNNSPTVDTTSDSDTVAKETRKGDDLTQQVQELRKAVIDLVRLNADDPITLKAGAQVLFLYVSNLSKNPHLPRFRKVFTSNDSFQKVDKLKGGRDLLCALGFVASSDSRFLEWPPTEMEQDGTTIKILTTPEKEALVLTYHLKETALALTIIKSISTKKSKIESFKEAALSLLKKALEVLPAPLSQPGSLPDGSSGAQSIPIGNVSANIVSSEPELESDETDARWK